MATYCRLPQVGCDETLRLSERSHSSSMLQLGARVSRGALPAAAG